MPTNFNQALYNSPIGTLEILSQENAITQIIFIDDNPAGAQKATGVLLDCTTQLDEYFSKKRHTFDLNIKLNGTVFQKQVWNEISKIPYGETISYLDIAKNIGNVMAVRAVGTANGANPIPIIIPCHRIVGTSGNLTGYSGGLWRKKWLLKHENALLV